MGDGAHRAARQRGDEAAGEQRDGDEHVRGAGAPAIRRTVWLTGGDFLYHNLRMSIVLSTSTSRGGFVDLLTPRARIDPAVSARICAWARELWAVPDEGTVFVTELRCAEPGCPPVETVVVISPRAGVTFQRKVHKAAVDVIDIDLQEARG